MTNPKQRDAETRVPLHLVPPVFMIGVAAVLREGASQEGRWPYNWRDNPVTLTTYISAAMRHLLALASGEDIDPKSGRPHEEHLGANAAIISDARACGTLIDDRHKVEDGAAELMRTLNREWTNEIRG